MLAGRHFPTDVLVGAAAGFAVGTAIPWLHARSRPGAGLLSRLRLVPAAGSGVGLAGSW